MAKNLSEIELKEFKRLFMTGTYSCKELGLMYGISENKAHKIADEALKDFKTKNK